MVRRCIARWRGLGLRPRRERQCDIDGRVYKDDKGKRNSVEEAREFFRTHAIEYVEMVDRTWVEISSPDQSQWRGVIPPSVNSAASVSASYHFAHRHGLHVMIVAVLNLTYIVYRLFAAAIAVADFLGDVAIAQQQHRLFDMTEPSVGIESHLFRQITAVQDMSWPAVVAGQGEANPVLRADFLGAEFE